MILSSCHSQSIAVLAATALLPTLHAFSLDRTFEESCSAFASEVDIPNVKVHFSQYLPTGYNLSIPDFVSLHDAGIVYFPRPSLKYPTD